MDVDANTAAILRARWRAELHDLNADESGAQVQRDYADLCERYNAAKAARDADRSNTMLDFAFQLVEGELRQYRRFMRELRDAVHAGNPEGAGVFTLDNFSEPTDAELLAGAQ